MSFGDEGGGKFAPPPFRLHPVYLVVRSIVCHDYVGREKAFALLREVRVLLQTLDREH